MAFTPEGERLIGDGAKNQLTTNPENTIFDAKRLIGRTWDDKSVQHDLTYFPFKVIEKNKKPHVQVNVQGEKKTFAAEEISAMVLTKMKVSLKINNKNRGVFLWMKFVRSRLAVKRSIGSPVLCQLLKNQSRFP